MFNVLFFIIIKNSMKIIFRVYDDSFFCSSGAANFSLSATTSGGLMRRRESRLK
jgi:hypothetical protein